MNYYLEVYLIHPVTKEKILQGGQAYNNEFEREDVCWQIDQFIKEQKHCKEPVAIEYHAFENIKDSQANNIGTQYDYIADYVEELLI